MLIETSDGSTEWSTVGVHENVIDASWQALEDAYTYGLLRAGEALPDPLPPQDGTPTPTG